MRIALDQSRERCSRLSCATASTRRRWCGDSARHALLASGPPRALEQRVRERRPRVHDVPTHAGTRDEAAGVQNLEMVGDVPRRPAETSRQCQGMTRFADAFEDLGARPPDQLGNGRATANPRTFSRGAPVTRSPRHGSARAWLGSAPDVARAHRSSGARTSEAATVETAAMKSQLRSRSLLAVSRLGSRRLQRTPPDRVLRRQSVENSSGRPSPSTAAPAAGSRPRGPVNAGRTHPTPVPPTS
jgi:hypothetical protein